MISNIYPPQQTEINRSFVELSQILPDAVSKIEHFTFKTF